MSIRNPQLTQATVPDRSDIENSNLDNDILLQSVNAGVSIVKSVGTAYNQFEDARVGQETKNALSDYQQQEEAALLESQLTSKELREGSGMDDEGLKALKMAKLKADQTGQRGLRYQMSINKILNEQIQRNPGRQDTILRVGGKFMQTDNLAIAIAQDAALEKTAIEAAQAREAQIRSNSKEWGVSTSKLDNGDIEGFYEEYRGVEQSVVKLKGVQRDAAILAAEDALTNKSFQKFTQEGQAGAVQEQKGWLDGQVLAFTQAKYGVAMTLDDAAEAAMSGGVDIDEIVRFAREQQGVWKQGYVESWMDLTGHTVSNATVEQALQPIDDQFNILLDQIGTTNFAEKQKALMSLMQNSNILDIDPGMKINALLEMGSNLSEGSVERALIDSIGSQKLYEAAAPIFGLDVVNAPKPGATNEGVDTATQGGPNLEAYWKSVGITDKKEVQQLKIGFSDYFLKQMNDPDFDPEGTGESIVNWVGMMSENYGQKVKLGTADSFEVSRSLIRVLAHPKYKEIKDQFSETVQREMGLNITDILGMEAKFFVQDRVPFIEDYLSQQAKDGSVTAGQAAWPFNLMNKSDVPTVDIIDPTLPATKRSDFVPGGAPTVTIPGNPEKGVPDKYVGAARPTYEKNDRTVPLHRVLKLEADGAELRWVPGDPKSVGLTEWSDAQLAFLERAGTDMDKKMTTNLAQNWVKAYANVNDISEEMAAKYLAEGIRVNLSQRRKAGLDK